MNGRKIAFVIWCLAGILFAGGVGLYAGTLIEAPKSAVPEIVHICSLGVLRAIAHFLAAIFLLFLGGIISR